MAKAIRNKRITGEIVAHSGSVTTSGKYGGTQYDWVTVLGADGKTHRLKNVMVPTDIEPGVYMGSTGTFFAYEDMFPVFLFSAGHWFSRPLTFMYRFESTDEQLDAVRTLGRALRQVKFLTVLQCLSVIVMSLLGCLLLITIPVLLPLAVIVFLLMVRYMLVGRGARWATRSLKAGRADAAVV